eukprot:SAG31_NODE_15460_length_754_cov_0.865649_1_plen_62_part_10
MQHFRQLAGLPLWEAPTAKRKPVDYDARIAAAKTEAQKATYRKMAAKQAARLAAEAALHTAE